MQNFTQPESSHDFFREVLGSVDVTDQGRGKRFCINERFEDFLTKLFPDPPPIL